MTILKGASALCAGIACFAVLALPLSGCAKKKIVKKDVQEEPAQEEEETIASQELDIRGKEFQSVPELQAAHFDYDSADLSETARKALAANAEYLQKHPELEVLSEGHCDERGTIGYNLALGQKRAQTVRKYYVSLGVPAAKIGSLSWGKEKPLCPDASEACWARNRRVETKVHLPQPSREKTGTGGEEEKR